MSEPKPAPPPEEKKEEPAADAEMAGEIRSALVQLDPQERNLLELRYLQDMSLKALLGILDLEYQNKEE